MTDTTATISVDSDSQDAPVNDASVKAQDGPVQLPDNHPLVTAYARQKAENEALRQKASAYEDAQKSETQKQAERLARLEADAQQARTEALRLRVAAKHGISDEDADLFLTGADEETLTRQAERLAAKESERKKRSNVVPREGNTPSHAANDEREFLRALRGN